MKPWLRENTVKCLFFRCSWFLYFTTNAGFKISELFLFRFLLCVFIFVYLFICIWLGVPWPHGPALNVRVTGVSKYLVFLSYISRRGVSTVSYEVLRLHKVNFIRFRWLKDNKMIHICFKDSSHNKLCY